MKENEILERLNSLESRLSMLEGENKAEELDRSKLIDTPQKRHREWPIFTKPEDMPVGTLQFFGKYASADGEIKSNFGQEGSISHILRLNSKTLAQVINAFSSEERIDIVKLLLKKALSAKDIMEILNFPTTGKVYHHLSFLEKMGVILKRDEKYAVSNDYVSCILLIITGAAQIIK